MHFSVAFLLVASRELTSTRIALKRFFSCVRSDVCCKVIRSRERSHTNAALKRFLSRVDANVSRQLIRSRESPIAVLNWARVWSLVYRRLTRSVRILSRFHWYQLERHWRLLVHLRQDLVTFTRRWVIFRQLNRVIATLLLLFLSLLLLYFPSTSPSTPATT